MSNLITILIVNYNSADFIELSLFALEKLTKNNYKVCIVDNNSKLDDYEKLKKITLKYKNVSLERSETELKGSMAHGTALNHLVKKVDTPYFSILDADATWLIKNWDEILIKLMTDKVKVIGTQAPGDKPKDFPLMFAILFESKIFNKLNIDFRPQDLDKLQDTGWELREKYLLAGYEGKTIEYFSTRVFKEGPFNSLIGIAEFYLNGYKNIFASHFGRGSTLGSNKYSRGFKRYFYKIPILGNFFIKRKGINEKQEWINICKNIVKKQINKV